MFPEKLIDREKYILDRVIAGQFEASWTDVSYSTGGYVAKFQVMEDALKIDGVRVNVSARLQQNLADLFDASLMTAQIADLVYISSVRRIDPSPMPISTSVTSMVKHSKSVDEKLKKLSNDSGLVADPGKHWILDKKLEQLSGRACNYGWHFLGASYQGINGFSAASSLNKINGSPVKVIQPNATAHDAMHTDYSQICQLVSQTCWVDGNEKRFSDLLTDSSLSVLVSHQGPLKITRQPGVSELKGNLIMFPVVVNVPSQII
jgi:hypothetical protein